MRELFRTRSGGRGYRVVQKKKNGPLIVERIYGPYLDGLTQVVDEKIVLERAALKFLKDGEKMALLRQCNKCHKILAKDDGMSMCKPCIREIGKKAGEEIISQMKKGEEKIYSTKLSNGEYVVIRTPKGEIKVIWYRQEATDVTESVAGQDMIRKALEVLWEGRKK